MSKPAKKPLLQRVHGAGGFSPAFLKSVLENGPGIGRSAEDHFVPASTQVMQGAPRLPCH
jgi:hypothetical protein